MIKPPGSGADAHAYDHILLALCWQVRKILSDPSGTPQIPSLLLVKYGIITGKRAASGKIYNLPAAGKSPKALLTESYEKHQIKNCRTHDIHAAADYCCSIICVGGNSKGLHERQ
jgi:hypothetical protein